MKPKILIQTLAFATCCAGFSNAATFYWDGGASNSNNLSDNATTSDLTWLGSDADAGYWDDGTSAQLTDWTAGDSAVFGGAVASQTITAGDLIIGNLTFGAGDDGFGTTGTSYTVSGGSITLSTGSAITTNTDSTINSSLIGSGSLIKQGAATLTLSGVNDYNGGTTISAGTLTLGHATDTLSNTGAVVVDGTNAILAIGTNSDTVGAVSLKNGGQITGSSGGTLTGTSYAVESGSVSAILGGSGALAKTTNGTVTLTGANTYTGATTISAGALNIRNATATGTTSGGVSVASGAALQLQGGITVGDEALTLNGMGVSNDGALRNISGNNFYGGLLTLGSATRINSDTTGDTLTLSNAGAITGTGLALTVGGAGNTAINSIIGTGAGTLTKDGSGTLTLSGANSFTGGTTISAGVISFASGSLGTTGSIRMDGGTLQWDGSNTQDVSGRITMLASKTATFDTGSNSVSFANTIGNSTNAALVKTGSGQLTLTGTGSYTGLTSVNNGTLKFVLSSDDRFSNSAGNIAIASNATFQLDTTGNYRFNRSALNYTGAGTFLKTGSSIAYLAFGSTAEIFNMDSGGLVNISQGTISDYKTSTTNKADLIINGTLQQPLATVYFDSLSGGGTLANANNMALNFGMDNGSGIFTGTMSASTGSFTKQGTGTQVLAGACAYTGATTINSGGTLQIGNGGTAGSLSINSVITTNGTLAFKRSDAISQGTHFSGSAISGSGGITQSGSGTLTLTGANTYTGATTISAGALNIRNATATGTTAGGVSVASGAAIQLQGGITVGDEALTLNGTGVSNDGALRNISGNNFYGGLLTLGSATRINSDTTGDTLTLSNAGAITGTGLALTVGGAGNTAINSIIGTGAGTLTKDGSGTLTLSGANSFTGGTTVNGGVISFASGSLGTTGSIRMDGGTLQWDGSNTQDVSGRITMLASKTATFDTGSNSVSFANTIGNSTNAALVKTGSGQLTLTGTGSYTGLTSVNNGTLKFVLSSDDRFSNSAGNIAIASNATFQLDTTGNYRFNRSALNYTGAGTFLKTGSSIAYLAFGSTAEIFNMDSGGLVNISQGTISDYKTSTTNKADLIINGTLQQPLATVYFDSLSGGGTLANANNMALNFGMDNGSGIFTGTMSASTGSFTKQGTGTQVLAGACAYTGATTINSGGTLQIGNGGTAGSLSINSVITTNGTLAFKRSDAISQGTHFSGSAISGSGGITQSGSGTLTLTGANTYTGATTISAGALNIRNATATGTTSGGVSVASGAALQLQGGITVGDEALTLNGTGVSNDGALRNISGNNFYGGLLTLGSATRINSDTTGDTLTLSNAGAITGTGLALTVGGAGNTAINSIIGTGAGTLTKDGSGTLTLSGANSFTGGTTVNGGTLVAGHVNAFGTGSIFLNSGTLDLSGLNITNAIALGGGTLIGTGALSGGFTSTGGTITANIGGTAGFTQTSGTTTLSGINSYTGATHITAGTLALTGAGSIENSISLSLGTVGTFDVSGTTSGAATVKTLKGSGAVIGELTVSTSLAIGNSPGKITFSDNLTLAAGSHYDYQLTGGDVTADLGDVAGNLTLTDSILDLTQLGTYTIDDKFTLFAYDGALGGTFAGLDDGEKFFGANGFWTINYADSSPGDNGGDGVSYVTITAVPEPSTAALLGSLGLLALLRRRRN